MNVPLPQVNMLSGGGSAKALFVLGVLVALAMVSNQKKQTQQSQ
jgi:predicted acylesterase/phospholipase RssA